MRPLVRGLVLCSLTFLEFVLLSQVIRLEHAGTGDLSQVLTLFLFIILVAIVIGVFVALTLVPKIGEAVGSFFFNPGGEIEKSPHSGAMAKIAQGDYEGAIEEYKTNAENDPEDVHALSEIVRLYCDKLEDHDAAEAFLTEALQKEWPPEQGAFLATRLVDVYWNHKRDAERARNILTQIAENMPDTRHAANAVHRLHEIERALADEEMNAHLHAGGAAPAALPEEAEAGSEPETETKAETEV